MESSGTIAKLAAALIKAQGEFPPIKKDKTANTGSYSYTYTDLAGLIEVTKPILTKNGLAVLQETLGQDGAGGVTTRIVHESGEWVEMGPLWLPAGGGPQNYGGSVTYARRYAYAAALGIASEDDDDAQQAQASVAKPPAPAQNSKKASEAQMKRLHALANQKGISHEQLSEYAAKHYSIDSLSLLTSRQASEMMESLNALSDVIPADA